MNNITITEKDQEAMIELCADLLYLQEQFGEELTRELTELAFLLNNLKGKKGQVEISDFGCKMLASMRNITVEEFNERVAL